MAGLLNINAAVGNQATGLYETTALEDAARRMYNAENRRTNEAALGDIAAYGAGAMSRAVQRYRQQDVKQPVAASGASPPTPAATGAAAPTPAPSTAPAHASLFSLFFNELRGGGRAR